MGVKLESIKYSRQDLRTREKKLVCDSGPYADACSFSNIVAQASLSKG